MSSSFRTEVMGVRSMQQLDCFMKRVRSPSRGAAFAPPSCSSGTFPPAPAVQGCRASSVSSANSSMVRVLAGQVNIRQKRNDIKKVPPSVTKVTASAKANESTSFSPCASRPRTSSTMTAARPHSVDRLSPRGASYNQSSNALAKQELYRQQSRARSNSASEGKIESTNTQLALSVARDISRRDSTNLNEFRRAQSEARIKRTLDIRYNMVVDDTDTAEEKNKPFFRGMKPIPRSGLIADVYLHNGRKFTPEQLLQCRVIDENRVSEFELARKEALVCGFLTQTNLDLIVSFLGRCKMGLATLALANRAACAAVETGRPSLCNDRSITEARGRLIASRAALGRIPRSFFAALRTMEGYPPAKVLFVVKLLVLILEKNSQLNSNPTFSGISALDMFRGFLSDCDDQVAAILEAEDPEALPRDTALAIERAISEEAAVYNYSTKELSDVVRSCSIHAHTALQWVLALHNCYKVINSTSE